MKVIIVDISGKVDNYSSFLADAVSEEMKGIGSTVFLTTRKIPNSKATFRKLFSLVPKKHWYSVSKWKRRLKAVEGIVNYFYVILYTWLHRVDVVHLQWLPYAEFNHIEKYFLRLLKGKRGRRRIVYTHHNLYPHGMNEERKVTYRNICAELFPLIDSIIVHTNNDKEKLHSQFYVPLSKIDVVHHGILEPREKTYELGSRNDNKIRFLMFGAQTEYKGTDLFVEAINMIPVEKREKMEFYIVGRTDDFLFKKYKGMADQLCVKWVPTTVSNEVLHTNINEADVIMFPYRTISQSGALLLALFFEKLILPSDIPSFKETLVGFKDDWFFTSEDKDALAKQMVKHLNLNNFDGEIEVVKVLKEKYSWESAAKKTISVYSKC